jgi:carboxylesterase
MNLSRARRKILILAGLPLLLMAAILVIVFRPPRALLSTARPNPARTFDEAEARITTRLLAEQDLIPLCRTRFLSHGKKTARVIVFVHGYTSCPEQFVQLGTQLFDAGSNVLIAPAPLHGLPDRMTELHAGLRSEQLVEYADEVVDIAQGLGDHVTVSGLSMGGLVTGWVAQNRPDVDLALLISPVFGYAAVPPNFTLPAANIFSLLPDKFEWWDTAQKEKLGPDYSYPRYSRRALAQLLRLAAAVMSDAKRNVPEASRIIVVTNDGDRMISSIRIGELVDSWRRHAPERVTTFAFPAEHGVGHDLIDPTLQDQNTEAIYPKLKELLNGGQ